MEIKKSSADTYAAHIGTQIKDVQVAYVQKKKIIMMYSTKTGVCGGSSHAQPGYDVCFSCVH